MYENIQYIANRVFDSTEFHANSISEAIDEAKLNPGWLITMAMRTDDNLEFRIEFDNEEIIEKENLAIETPHFRLSVAKGDGLISENNIFYENKDISIDNREAIMLQLRKRNLLYRHYLT